MENMKRTLMRAGAAVVVAVLIYLISQPIIRWTDYEVRSMAYLTAVIGGGCCWIGSR